MTLEEIEDRIAMDGLGDAYKNEKKAEMLRRTKV